MVIGAEHMLKLAALRRSWWRLHMSETFSRIKKNQKQTNKQIQFNQKKKSNA